MTELNMTLKDALELQEKLQVANDKVLETIYKILFDIQELYGEYNGIEDLKEQFIIWENLLNNEFTINYPFGNIDMNLLNAIDKRFRKEGFYLNTISDCEARSNDTGLIFYFKKGLF